MSDDLSKVWGYAIHPGGMRPEGIENDCLILWSNNGKAWKEVHVCNVRVWGDCDNDVSIRLPADHPYYRQFYKPTPAEHANGAYGPDCTACREYAEPDMGFPISDPIAKRMEALVRAIADVPRDSVLGQSGYASEARAIGALLPEPVDGDVLEARGICAGIALRRGDRGLAAEYTAGLCDSQFEMEAVIASVRTRALERDSREG